jgi:acetoin utilization deacetylase AcuC-like enzyme
MVFVPVVWHEAYEVDIGVHVFPMTKYRRVRDTLLADGTIRAQDVHRPEPATDAQVQSVHTARYVGAMRAGALTLQEERILELPFSAALRDASWLCAGGSILTARLALEHGIAVHLGGGFHHAFPDHGEGFCLIHDVAIATRVLQAERAGAVARVAIVDLDVHHGNGTAAIFAEDPAVLTFSMHQQDNYPALKPASDLDLGLRDLTGDDEYLALLEEHLPRILDAHHPDLVWYVAGADPYEHDQLGGLALTRAGLRRRDEIVYARCGERGIPVAVAFAGGYAVRESDTIEIHSETARAARRRLEEKPWSRSVPFS